MLNQKPCAVRYGNSQYIYTLLIFIYAIFNARFSATGVVTSLEFYSVIVHDSLPTIL